MSFYDYRHTRQYISFNAQKNTAEQKRENLKNQVFILNYVLNRYRLFGIVHGFNRIRLLQRKVQNLKNLCHALRHMHCDETIYSPKSLEIEKSVSCVRVRIRQTIDFSTHYMITIYELQLQVQDKSQNKLHLHSHISQRYQHLSTSYSYCWRLFDCTRHYIGQLFLPVFKFLSNQNIHLSIHPSQEYLQKTKPLAIQDT